jgi:hypothetical protein
MYVTYVGKMGKTCKHLLKNKKIRFQFVCLLLSRMILLKLISDKYGVTWTGYISISF